ncbi:methionine--tRNA ligase [Acidisphaera sp. L21]|uniref:methionine--tRNA ligase n=1 Tax=Acidisphaera sp. L21 TaxID=1641851 RepID=UPI00131BFB1D|nr:methionine--tRNA ligase [Acidisphaera sp. L21]
MTETFYITTPIYYVNGAPHIGHAYTSIAADVLARWMRMEGREVYFLTGTDEHGQKVAQAAAAAGQDPQSFVDGLAAEFRDMSAKMNISNDDFIRTTEERHKQGCAALWKILADKDEIYLGHYEGWYALRDEAFYGEDEVTTRPDGTKISPFGSPVEWVKEPNYLFRMSAWGDRLLAFYEANPEFLGPSSTRSEIISFVKGGMTDLSVSRASLTWGVPVPGDPEQVMYVWLDALANYITALGYPDESAPLWRFWPANVHFVGKDIARFHTVIWPAFLMAAGIPVPKRVYANGWWTVEGEKMSKSVGNVIDPRDLVKEFGLDVVRFFLLREMPFGNDGDFNRRALIGRMNSELANDLGNLAQRSLSLIARNCDAKLPERGPATEDDTEILSQAMALPGIMQPKLLRQIYGDALEDAWKVIRAANAYIDRQAPWVLRKTDTVRMAAVLRVLADALRPIATVLLPFMPGAMGAMLDQLGVPADARDFAALATPLPGGITLPPPQGIFPRYTGDAA